MVNLEKNSIKKKISSMQEGDSLDFPIQSWATCRYYASTLNTIYYKDGERWTVNANRQNGTVTVTKRQHRQDPRKL